MREKVKKKTMTSLQIAETTGKTHSNVMRDIRNILEQLEEKHKFNCELMFKITKLGKNLKKTSVNFSVKGRNLC